MKLILLILFYFSLSIANGQRGYLKTKDDSLLVGFVRIIGTDPHRGYKLIYAKQKKDKPKTFFSYELAEFAIKEDTFSVLRNFYPFENDEELYIEQLNVLRISKGKLSVYKGTIEKYSKSVFDSYGLVGAIGYSTDISRVNPRVVMPLYSGLNVLFVKDDYGSVFGIKKNQKDFISTMTRILEKDRDLVYRVQSGEFEIKDIVKVTSIYNSRN